MRHALKVPYTEANEQVDRLPMYEILSIVLKKLMNLILVMIKNEKFSSTLSQKSDDKKKKEDAINSMSIENRVLIYEVSAMCALMCSQCSLFMWSTMEVKQQGQHARTRRTP